MPFDVITKAPPELCRPRRCGWQYSSVQFSATYLHRVCSCLPMLRSLDGSYEVGFAATVWVNGGGSCRKWLCVYDRRQMAEGRHGSEE